MLDEKKAADAADVTIDQVTQQMTDLQTAVSKEESDITTYIAGLKAQIASGSPVTPAQLDALSASITGLSSMVGTFDLTTTAPPTTPAPAAALNAK